MMESVGEVMALAGLAEEPQENQNNENRTRKNASNIPKETLFVVMTTFYTNQESDNKRTGARKAAITALGKKIFERLRKAIDALCQQTADGREVIRPSASLISKAIDGIQSKERGSKSVQSMVGLNKELPMLPRLRC